MEQQPSTIYKSYLRGSKIGEDYGYYATLNFENYYHESRVPFGQVTVCNDEVISPKKSITYTFSTTEVVVIIPLLGTLHHSGPKNTGSVSVNQILVLKLFANQELKLTNPSNDDLANYVQLRFKSGDIEGCFDFNYFQKNTLEMFLHQKQWRLSMGIFDTRKEWCFTPISLESRFFVFVIHGAFECQNRLIEERDALGIWGLKTLDFESLTENGIVLIIET